MSPILSQTGTQMSSLTGVKAIMNDVVETLRAGNGRDFINLSVGNPVILPQVEELWRDCNAQLLASKEYGEVVCRYGSSQGYTPLVEAIVNDFNQRYKLNLNQSNVLITPGSQSLFFYAINAFGGYTNSGELRQIVLPLSPDYTGYAGASLVPEAITAYKPILDIDADNHRLKYRPDFGQLSINQHTGCVIFSRPCNPTGNVLSDDEVGNITAMAEINQTPILVDSAYACPYPALNFTEMTPVFGKNIVHCMSLSKAGLPGERIGIAVGDEKIIQVLESFQTNACIHASRYGQAIAARAINSGALTDISERVIKPFYQNKFTVLESALDKYMPTELPWFLHLGEGTIFAWLWLKDLPVSDWDFYQQLKLLGVIVVPGSIFFPGLKDDWEHKNQCLRISLTGSNQEIDTAMSRLAQVVSQLYSTHVS